MHSLPCFSSTNDPYNCLIDIHIYLAVLPVFGALIVKNYLDFCILLSFQPIAPVCPVYIADLERCGVRTESKVYFHSNKKFGDKCV